MKRTTAKPIVIAVTGFISTLTFLLWVISLAEFDQLHRFGEQPLSLPPGGHVLHALYHASWLLPAAAGILGGRLLRAEEPAACAVSRYCSYFILAACIWAFVAIFGFYSIYAMNHHKL